MIPIKKKKDGISFKAYVQPRSSKNAVAGLYADALKIRLTAPPVDGEANRMCITFLAKTLNLPKSAIKIVSGRAGRTKQVLICCDKDDDTFSQELIHKIENLIDLKKS